MLYIYRLLSTFNRMIVSNFCAIYVQPQMLLIPHTDPPSKSGDGCDLSWYTPAYRWNLKTHGSEWTLTDRCQRAPFPLNWISKATIRVVVFHCWQASHLYYTSHVTAQSQTRVKLNRVFFPR